MCSSDLLRQAHPLPDTLLPRNGLFVGRERKKLPRRPDERRGVRKVSEEGEREREFVLREEEYLRTKEGETYEECTAWNERRSFAIELQRL